MSTFFNISLEEQKITHPDDFSEIILLFDNKFISINLLKAKFSRNYEYSFDLAMREELNKEEVKEIADEYSILNAITMLNINKCTGL